MPEGYFCKECGAPAEVNSHGIIRTCEHTGTITLGMVVTCYGEGHVDTKPSRLSRMVEIICSILGRAKK